MFSTSKSLPFSSWCIFYFSIKFQAFFLPVSNPNSLPRDISPNTVLWERLADLDFGVFRALWYGREHKQPSHLQGAAAKQATTLNRQNSSPPPLRYTPHPKSLSIIHTRIWSGQGSDFGKVLRIFFMNSSIPLCGLVNHSGLFQFPLLTEF